MPSQRPLRIAILECDTPLDGTRAKYGSYGGVFKALLEAGANLLAKDEGRDAVPLALKYYDVVTKQEYPSDEDIDAVLLTGSRHNSFENDPWILKLVEYTRRLLREQSRIRVIGVCFGHQIVGRAMDVKVDRSDRGWEVAVTPMELTAKGKDLFGIANRALSLHQMHRDIVYVYPPEVEQLGQSDRCAVQGMYINDRLITVQGHPEFTGDIVAELLEARHASGVFNDELYKDGVSRVRKDHDGVVVGKAFIKFAREG